MRNLLSFSLILLLLSACASKPILAPNKKYQQMGHERSEADIDRCVSKAEDQLAKTKDRRVLRSTGKGAAVGAVAGGVIGSTGHTGVLGGAAIGAAGGAIVGAIIGAAHTPEEAKRGLVNYCLKQKGYEVAGWED